MSKNTNYLISAIQRNIDAFILSVKNWRTWVRVALSAVIFFAVALPFRELFSLLPGVTEIRPANVIPPVLGIIWGPAAALGISFGNLISDILSGSNGFICITGFISNFFYAYIPYKLWYSFAVNEEDVEPTLDNVQKILKYIFIIFIDSLVVTASLSLIFETAGFMPSAGSYVLLFFNNFDFAVLLGVPILIILQKFNLKYHIPQSEFVGKHKFIIFDIFLYIIGGLGFFWFISSTISGLIFSQTSSYLLTFTLVLMITNLFKPFNFNKVPQNKDTRLDVKITIKAKVTIGFLIIATFFTVFIAVIAYNSNAEKELLELWSYLYFVVGVAINVVFASAIAFLWYVERNIVTPIETLTRGARDFAARPTTDEILRPNYIKVKTNDEIHSLASSFNMMMKDLTDYMHDLKEVTADKERIATELNVATQIQSSMLPCIFPAFPEREEFDIYASMKPAKEVGGDFYDFFLIDYTHLAVVVADVSGKGVPAALFMVIAKTLIKNHTLLGQKPSEVFTAVNAQLCENNEAGMFVTAWMGILDIETGDFSYVNAGHNPPVIKRNNGDFEYLRSRAGFVLAGMDGIVYKQNEIKLENGDVLYLYTDGVTEATNEKDELFGEDALLNVMNENKEDDPTELLNDIQKSIDKFVGDAPQFDDITMLGLKIIALGGKGEQA